MAAYDIWLIASVTILLLWNLYQEHTIHFLKKEVELSKRVKELEQELKGMGLKE